MKNSKNQPRPIASVVWSLVDYRDFGDELSYSSRTGLPAVSVIEPSVLIVPIRSPAVPDAQLVTDPKLGIAPVEAALVGKHHLAGMRC